MRIKTKVTDLSVTQWDLLQRILLTSYDISPEVVRVCAEFELTEMVSRHVEMPVRAFAGLMTRLDRHEREQAELVQAALTPDALPDTESGQDPLPGPTCDHGSPVVKESPSFFKGAQPTRTYADNCQSYGPYQKDPLPVDQDLFNEIAEKQSNFPGWDAL